MSGSEKQASASSRRQVSWFWRVLTLGLAGAAAAAGLAARRVLLDPALLAADEEARRRACLGFPLPVMLRGTRDHHFRDPHTGTHTLSYRAPASYAEDAIYAYYDAYLRENGFAPSSLESAGGQNTRLYRHADGLRAASVSVRTEPLRGEHRTVIVTVRPV